MAVVYRSPTKHEYKIIKQNLLYWFDESIYEQMLLNYELIVGAGNWREVHLINTETMKFLKENKSIKPFSAGLLLGEIKDKDLLISISGAQKIAKYTPKKIIVNSKAEQLFLYKRDVYSSSIVECKSKFNQNDKLLVMNETGDCLGVGKMLFSDIELREIKSQNKTAIKNLIDLSWYLRKGK